MSFKVKRRSFFFSKKNSSIDCPLPEELEDDVDVPIDYELYVDDPRRHLVALGNLIPII